MVSVSTKIGGFFSMIHRRIYSFWRSRVLCPARHGL